MFEYDDEPRYDVLITPGRDGFRVADQGVRALLSYFTMTQLLALREQVDGDGWTELFLDPDQFAHHLFRDGPAPPGGAPLIEAILRVGAAATGQPYGAQLGRDIHVYLELVGARWPDVAKDFLDKLQQIVWMRPQTSVKPHAPPPPHAPGRAAAVRREARAAAQVVDRD
ncbi:MAG: hypothetical protein H6745_19350 [Deltaproteobacteria bacterium]|nr:hypothetical protein [Deltaproteobacteria bacterium]